MDFSLTEEQKMLKAMVQDFAAKELEPIAAQIDEEARFPAESVKKMAELGLTGIGLPEEYGGSGGGATEFCIVIEEISRVCAATGTILLASSGLAIEPVYLHGNEEQRKRFVTPVASGEKLAAFALTEAGAGSDPASMETTATRHNNGYLLNGTKVFITNGAEAGVFLVFATIDKSLRHNGITAFIVERDTPGFSVGKHERKLGIRASSTVELTFEDCFVPEENRLGGEGEGFKIAIGAIDASRVVVAAQALGIAQGAFDKALAYAKERQQFGQPIANFQAIQWMLADMATQIDAARLLTYRAAYLQDKGLPFIKEASMAKVFAAETSSFVTNKAIQIYGGYGYIKEHPLERYLRDAKITEIYEGTSEMQRMTIARQLIREG
ncbi:MAG TPA: acyl-CoA dehydrogenase [Dehalococcoidia bacterium]|jgi:alkylation response protein AidB-like acyl-CoA dehydrogenase|nr:acyl-CoA dehydrogenase [Dehalococcoidia bacterium]